MWPWAMTLTLCFQVQILKKPYSKNGRTDWLRMKGMWVYRKSDSICDFEFWPHPLLWILKVKFWKSSISRMGGLINMEWKGCESIGCWTHYVTLNYDLHLGFSRSNVKKSSIIGIRGLIDMEPKGCESIGCWTRVVTLNFDLTHDLDLGFSKSNFL